MPRTPYVYSKTYMYKPVSFSGIDRILSDRCSSTPPSSSAVTQKSSPRAQRREEKGEERMGTKHTLELPEVVTKQTFSYRKTLVAGVPHYGVFCNKPLIEKGTKFGPFKGRVINAGEMKPPEENSSMWEEGKLSHFIDGRRNAGNWMALVNCARFAQEQNLVALQVEGDVFYEACRDIPQGRELLVWYGDAAYQPLMGGVPATRREKTENDSLKEAESSEGYQCERCGKVFAYRYYRDKHLKYTRFPVPPVHESLLSYAIRLKFPPPVHVSLVGGFHTK
ncbi:hypothetical protein DPMN_121254 [Dreissena polymorpha]|uniref:Uncharacterized protein n=1 Tax=Dreissena polymorpha TaxID=45954 RepID=A0A9D4JPC3_DREPO|nr:hypothetical protein DPMN_121254 [Dreissena polymorpha]